MEILKVSVVTDTALTIGFFVLSVIFAITAVVTGDSKRTIIPLGSMVIAIVLFVVFTLTAAGIIFPTEEKEYTIEITTPGTYQWLIENGYDIQKRVYESKDIYKICGDPLPDLEWITPLN